MPAAAAAAAASKEDRRHDNKQLLVSAVTPGYPDAGDCLLTGHTTRRWLLDTCPKNMELPGRA